MISNDLCWLFRNYKPTCCVMKKISHLNQASMSHQENIAHCVTALLVLEPAVVASFRKGNPFDKLIRSFDEHSADGKPLYKKESGRKHYKMSVAAYESNKPVKELHGEHRLPVSCLIKNLLASDRTSATVLTLLRSNEVILITKEEARYLDSPLAKGGMGLKMCLPKDGLCRLKAANINIAPETLNNSL